MGWAEYQANYYKNGKIDRKAECDAELKGNGHLEVLKSAMVGTTYYAAIKDISDNTVFAAVYLTSTRDNRWFGYKAMDECAGPYKYKCPKVILNMLTEPINDYAKSWREKCWEYHNTRNMPLSSFPVGSILEFTFREEVYRAIKTYGKAYIEVDRTSKEEKLKKIDTYWAVDHRYDKINSRVLNSLGFTIIHLATKEEQEELRKAQIEKIFNLK